jgi:RimJ/RimL family protein N-acetyltransferase
MSNIYIRPLEVKDAQVSCKWRNNPRIWRFTGSKPDKYITPEIETEWVGEVLKRPNEKRFAICLATDARYIGNIFFTDIKEDEAQMHIFIGDMEYWGKKRAYDAICLIFDYGFQELKLETIYTQINPKNLAAILLGKSVGFVKVAEFYDTNKDMMLVKMNFTHQMYLSKKHLKGINPVT